MWTAKGPLGAGVANENPGAEVTKILPTDREYSVGRKKESPIWVDSKRVSINVGTFVIGPFSEEDVSHPERRPKVTVRNDREEGKVITVGVKETGEKIDIASGDTLQLKDGLELKVSGKMSIGLVWTAVCCYVHPRSGPVPTKACSKIGIHLTQALHPDVNYHLTQTYTPTAQLAAALIANAHIVKLEWLHEMIRMAESDELVMTFPTLTKFRPVFSPALDARHKRFEVWEASGKRKTIFSSLRFLCAGEKNREVDSQVRFMIERGEGTIETFDVKAAARQTKWNRAISRGMAKEGKSLVILGSQEGIVAAIGEDGWKELVDEAQTFGLVFKSIDDVVLSVLDNDTSGLKPEKNSMEVDEVGQQSSSPIPDVIPNTMPEEETHPPETPPEEAPVRKRPPRRAASRQPSELPQSPPSSPKKTQPPSQLSSEPGKVVDDIAPAAEAAPPEPKVKKRPPRRPTTPMEVADQPAPATSDTTASQPVPRRPPRRPTRRLDGESVVTGLGDDSLVVADTPVTRIQRTIPQVVDYTAPIRTRTTRPKRRIESVEPASRETSLVPEERVTRKYKSLFEESDPSKNATTSLSEMMSSAIEETPPMSSQTMNSGRSKTATQATGLDVVLEEPDMSETQTTGSSQNPSRSRKRKATSEDEEMAGVEDALAPSQSSTRMGSVPPPSKRAAIANVNAVQASQVSKPSYSTVAKPASSALKKANADITGAQAGKPDTDDAFLKAVASTKRGKKHEDEFDREFNKLKISKPELAREEHEDQQWKVLEEFGDDSGLRGNFMMIVEFEAPRSRARNNAGAENNPEWNGKPNFKKFKKKSAPATVATQSRGAKIDLVLNEPSTYGLGTGSWKEEPSEAAIIGDSQDIVITESTKTRRSQPLVTQRTQPFVIQDSDSEEIEETTKKRKRGASAKPAAPSKRAKKSTQPLFLDDSDSGDNKDEDEPDATLESAPSSSRPTINTRNARAKAKPIVVDDDSDDDGFKGFKPKGRRR